jgi:DNA invertase Pin-like site-specific DNA recombinase
MIYDYITRVSKMGSRRGSDESTMTVDDQREQCVGAIKEKGGRVGKEHKALNQSGKTSVDSKPYREALARIRRGESQGIAVALDDRLARDWRKLGRYYDEMESAGAEIIIVNLPGVDYRTSNGRTQTRLMAIVAEMKYATAKDRGDKMADRTIERGVPNRVPFGYRRNAGMDGVKVDPERDGKALVPDPKTAPLVERIFEMRVDGHSWVDIGKWLEAQKVPSPRGGSWAVSTLRNMIANEMYLGVITLGERRLEDAHAPLISRTLWRQAQSSRTLQRTGRNVAGIAGGLLTCHSCGRTLSVTGTQNPSYTCRRQLGGKCDAPVYVSKKRADAYVEEMITDLLAQGSGQDVIATSWEIGDIRKALSDARAELEQYVKTAKALDADLFKMGLDARQADVDQARDALDELTARAEVAAELPTASGWAALTLDRKRMVARGLLDYVEVCEAEGRGRSAEVEARLDFHWRGENDPPWQPAPPSPQELAAAGGAGPSIFEVPLN